GQHGDGAVRQVDAAAAAPGLDVDGRALAHVVRHVGHRHPQPRAAVGQLLDRHRVVEVARRLGVDGGEGNVAQVGAVGAVALGQRLAHAGGDSLDLVGETLVDVGDRQHLLDLGARVVGVAQHLQHRGLDRAVGHVGVAGDLGDHGDAVLGGRDRTGQAHQSGDARVVGLQHLLATPAHQLAGDLGAPALDDAQDAPLEAARAHPGFDLDGVRVHGGAPVGGRDVDVLGLVVGDDEAVAGGVDLDPAR